MRRNAHPLIAAALVILCILFIWGTSPAQEQTCKVLSEQEAKDAALFEDWAVTLQCPGKTLWVPRKEYRIAEACTTVKMRRDADGLHWVGQEGECVVMDTATIVTAELAARQQCAHVAAHDKEILRFSLPNLNGGTPCSSPPILPKWR